MTSRTERFERKARPSPEHKLEVEEEEVVRFSAEEEAALLKESSDFKTLANQKFAAAEYTNAIEIYDKALECCPKYLAYERAVLKSNVAACYIKLGEWKDAVKVSTESLELLDSLDPKKAKAGMENADAEGGGGAKEEKVEEEADEEIITPGAAKAENTSNEERRKTDIERIRSKALLRRGKARSEVGGWSALQGAEEDYKELSKMSNLSPADRKVVQRQLILLPPRTKEAQEKEVGEMMGKLKQLGNGILKPFGLSTDNFQMVKDEKTGSYSMNFNQGASSGSK